MGSGTTAVQGWPFPELTDAPTVSADIGALANALDVVAKRLSGLASARPTASATPVDTIYYATDTGVYSISTGAVWGTMFVAGAWTALGLGTFVVNASGYNVARVRQEGDLVKFSGMIQNGSGATITVGSPVVTGIPSNLAPPESIGLSVSIASAGTCDAVQLGIGPGQTALSLSSSSGSWPPGYFLSLEDLSYPLT